MTKKLIVSFAGLLMLLGVLGGVKALQITEMIAQGKAYAPAPETVTAAVAETASWESLLTAVGSLEAVQGVTVAAEIPGRVEKIEFEAGTDVEKGDVLVRQDTSSERARLRSAEASLALARNELERKKALLERRTISQSDYDKAEAQYKQALAEVENIRTVIAKKTIRAPFAGKLGIRLVNLGQILNEAEPVVSLQSLDPIYVNFNLPQQKLSKLKQGLTVRLTVDSMPGEKIEGRITAINPLVDDRTRSVRVQATVPNPDQALRPGMFANISVVLPARKTVVSIPTTAVLYAPYSDSVFVVEEKKDQDGQLVQTVRQQFVRLGEKNGDFIEVADGLQAGRKVVSTGVFKLRNGQSVVVDNSLAPDFNLSPSPEDS